MRNEEAINSTGNRIYSLKVFHFLKFIDGRVFLRIFAFYIVFDYLFLNGFSQTRFILAMTGKTSAVAGYMPV